LSPIRTSGNSFEGLSDFVSVIVVVEVDDDAVVVEVDVVVVVDEVGFDFGELELELLDDVELFACVLLTLFLVPVELGF